MKDEILYREKLVSRYRIYKPHVEIICFLCLNIKEQFDA